MRIKLVSDIHGAAEALAREAAGADALLVCGDLVNLIDYRTMQGIAAEVFGPEVTADFVRLRTAGRFDEAGLVLRGASEGREEEIRDQVRVAVRAQYEAVFAAFPEPTYLTHGNVDRPEQFQDLLRPGVRHLDGETVEVDGLRVGFVGGGLPRGSRPHLSECTHEEFAAKVAAARPGRRALLAHAPGRRRPALRRGRGPARAGQPGPARLRGGAPARLPVLRPRPPAAAQPPPGRADLAGQRRLLPGHRADAGAPG